jgi:hypothetical protein
VSRPDTQPSGCIARWPRSGRRVDTAQVRTLDRPQAVSGTFIAFSRVSQNDTSSGFWQAVFGRKDGRTPQILSERPAWACTAPAASMPGEGRAGGPARRVPLTRSGCAMLLVSASERSTGLFNSCLVAQSANSRGDSPWQIHHHSGSLYVLLCPPLTNNDWFKQRSGGGTREAPALS